MGDCCAAATPRGIWGGNGAPQAGLLLSGGSTGSQNGGDWGSGGCHLADLSAVANRGGLLQFWGVSLCHLGDKNARWGLMFLLLVGETAMLGGLDGRLGDMSAM